MMKRIAAVAAGVMVVAGLAVAAQTDVSGTWNFVVNLDAGSGEPVFVFMQDGETLTGDYVGTFGSASVTGTVEDDMIEFTFGAEGVGGDTGHDRRVDAARQADHDVGEAVLAEVVARAEHERVVQLAMRVEFVGDRRFDDEVARTRLRRHVHDGQGRVGRLATRVE